MEFWLSNNNKSESFQLPIPPKEFDVKQGNMNQTVNVENIGEVNIIGKGKLAAITVSSFFPAQMYPFCAYKDFPSPYKCVEMIEKWRKDTNPVRLIITKTDINLKCCIESFTYGENDGSGDVYYTIELKEYRDLNTPTESDSSQSSPDTSRKREQTKETPKYYVVKPGDTLWTISQRTYGDGSKWKSIADKNGIKDPKKLQTGKKLML